ncbi:MAG: transaldolase family protein [Cyanobacteria bacterium J06623_4]
MSPQVSPQSASPVSSRLLSPCPPLRFYLDSAEVSAWETWLPTGLFYGVTCNPLLLARASVVCEIETLARFANQAFDLGAQEVHLQVWGESAADLSQTGQLLGEIDRRVVVKFPATQPGTTAAASLIRAGMPVTLTAVYAARQVLIAAAIGASYVAPYLGRMNDAGRDGRREVATMQQMLAGVGSQTRVLTASIRAIEDISVLSAQGVDTFTFSEKIARAFFEVPATLKATAEFEQAAKAAS